MTIHIPLNIKCIHCKVRRKARRRGLCHRCYYTAAVRVLYVPTKEEEKEPEILDCSCKSLYANLYHTPPLPPTPTNALPGTEEKLAILIARAEQGYHLWHPDDKVVSIPKGCKLTKANNIFSRPHKAVIMSERIKKIYL